MTTTLDKESMMKTENSFDIEVQDYLVHILTHEDIQALQTLYEQCRDFMLLVDGHPAGEHAAEEEFQDLPPGKSADDHFMFGIVDRSNQLAGLLDVVRAYPDEATWWIGLLLLAPESRSQGIGEKVLEGFAGYVGARGGKALMLGVVKENEAAYRFWRKMGFGLVCETEPRQFGDKIHTVRVMRRNLEGRS